MTTLEKIREEISSIEISGQIDINTSFVRTSEQVKNMALEIIDKYAEQEPCDDAVSREQLLKVVTGDSFNSDFPRMSKALAEIIKSLPTVRLQEPKTGHWINADGDNAICGCCNRLNHLYGEYCKHCGAKMESGV